jgi:imidazolonepropionase-like amidohydrolase
VGPRILAAGLWIGKQGGVCEFNGIGVAGGADAFRRRVRENIEAGADLIKLCVSGWPAEAFAQPDRYELDDEAMTASVAEARRTGKRVIAHDLSRAGVAAALRAGVNGLAHAAYVDSALAVEMNKRNVFLIPTLASLTSGDSSAAARALIAAVTLAQRRGVTIVFGTDAGVLPHGGNAAEFSALTNAGLTPIDALRAATSNAASALGLADSIGAIRPGMVADLIAVNGDVLNDVGVLQNPRLVMARGRIVRR